MGTVHLIATAMAQTAQVMANRSMLRTLLWLSLAILPLGGCERRPAVDSLPDASTIDSTARALMQREHVQGLALAVIDKGSVVHVAAYGIRNAAGDPLTTQTILYGASLTKTAFTYMVMQRRACPISRTLLRARVCSGTSRKLKSFDLATPSTACLDFPRGST